MLGAISKPDDGEVTEDDGVALHTMAYVGHFGILLTPEQVFEQIVVQLASD